MARAAEEHARAVQRLRLARDIGDVDTLHEALTNPRLREAAARFVGELGRADSVPLLLPLLSAADPSARGAAAAALGEIGAAGVQERLLGLLDDPVARVRRIAATALGGVGDADALGAIREAERRDSPLRRGAYRRAVRAISARAEPHRSRGSG